MNLDQFIPGKFGHYTLPFPVTFIGKNGYPGEPEAAIAAGLVVGKSYDNCSVEVRDCDSRITIPGQPGTYNSVMFE